MTPYAKMIERKIELQEQKIENYCNSNVFTQEEIDIEINELNELIEHLADYRNKLNRR